tara:strand:+ start:92 stop:478 length:387 start_codon:yes stop_codon:yes gene_type:complete
MAKETMNHMLTNSETVEQTSSLYEKMLQDKDSIYRSVIAEIKSTSKDRIDDLKTEINFLRKDKSEIQSKYEKAILDLSKARIEAMRSQDKAIRYDQLSTLLSKLIDKISVAPTRVRKDERQNSINPLI